ncbi:MAG: stalk domain-containing protein [Tissierellia bacterium]|nr:stalk domain-containing protein [Tissierellia bacterium]
MKKTFFLALACLFLMSGMVFAQEGEEAKKAEGYQLYFGEVTEVMDEGKFTEILVKNELHGEEGLEEVYLYVDEALIVDLATGELVEEHSFTKGEKIQYFFKDNTPVMQSLPPKLSPDVVAIHLDEAQFSLDVDHFDGEGRGVSNRLVINVADDTVGQNVKGEEVKDVLDKDLAVLYTVATRSLPPIATPDKILVLEDKNGPVSLFDFRAPMEKGFYLRKYYEALGATVEWNQQYREISITMGEKSVAIMILKPQLQMGDEKRILENFTVEDGISYISQEDVERINDYLLK